MEHAILVQGSIIPGDPTCGPGSLQTDPCDTHPGFPQYRGFKFCFQYANGKGCRSQTDGF